MLHRKTGRGGAGIIRMSSPRSTSVSICSCVLTDSNPYGARYLGVEPGQRAAGISLHVLSV